MNGYCTGRPATFHINGDSVQGHVKSADNEVNCQADLYTGCRSPAVRPHSRASRPDPPAPRPPPPLRKHRVAPRRPSNFPSTPINSPSRNAPPSSGRRICCFTPLPELRLLAEVQEAEFGVTDRQAIGYRFEAAQCLEHLGETVAALAEYRALLPYPELAPEVRRRISVLRHSQG